MTVSISDGREGCSNCSEDGLTVFSTSYTLTSGVASLTSILSGEDSDLEGGAFEIDLTTGF